MPEIASKAPSRSRLLQTSAWRCLLVAGMVALSAPAAWAQGQAADQQRFDQLFNQMLAAPTQVDLIYQFVEVALRLDNVEAAITALERLLILNPNLPAVRVQLGNLYSRIGSYEFAQAYYQRVADDATAPEALRQQARQQLVRVQAAGKPKEFSGSLSAGLRFQSNARLAPDSASVRSAGSDVFLSNSFRSEEDFNVFGAGTLTHQLPISAETTWVSNGLAYGTRQFEETQLNLMLVDLDTGPKFTFNAEMPGFSIRPYVLARGIMLQDSWYSGGLGGGLELSQQVTEELGIDLIGQARRQTYKNSSDRPTVDQYNGWESSATLRGRYQFTPNNMLIVDAKYARADTEQSYYDFRAFELSADYLLRFDSPIQGLEAWTAVFGVGRRWVDYRAADPAVDPRVKREDREWRFTVTGVVPITPEWSVFAQIEPTFVESNLKNYEYDNFSALIGATWSF